MKSDDRQEAATMDNQGRTLDEVIQRIRTEAAGPCVCDPDDGGAVCRRCWCRSPLGLPDDYVSGS